MLTMASMSGLSLESTEYAGGQTGPAKPEGIEEVLYGSLDLSETVLEDILQQELSLQARHGQTPTNAQTCQEVLNGRLYGRHDLSLELAKDGVREAASPGDNSLVQSRHLRLASA